MSWQDRDYVREHGRGRWGSVLWALAAGSAPLGTWFGIRVRVHVTLILFTLLYLIFPPYMRELGYARALETAAVGMAILFCIVLLHEFGHCLAARRVGGTAEEILLWPLGGLAFAQPPRHPWPTFVTVAGGPSVNVLICLLTAGALLVIEGSSAALPLNPLRPMLYGSGAAYYLGWIFYISYLLLLFNLLPIFPLDGGQMLQTALWARLGYATSMRISTVTGMIGAGVLAVFAIVSGAWLALWVALAGLMYCYQQRLMLASMDPAEMESAGDFSGGVDAQVRHHRHHHLSRRIIRKARKLAAREQAEQAHIDQILAKVSAHGMSSLNWRERRTLRKATQRQRELESPRMRS